MLMKRPTVARTSEIGNWRVRQKSDPGEGAAHRNDTSERCHGCLTWHVMNRVLAPIMNSRASETVKPAGFRIG